MRATGEGIIGAMMVGGFSEYMKVEEAELGYNLFALPDSLTYDDGALTEPFAVGMGGVNTSNVQPTDRALILGAGPVGLGALAGMKALGVESVVVSDLSEFRLQKAKALGADAIHNPKETPLEDFLLKLYGERVNSWGLVDVIIDAAGAKPALESALDVTRYQSRVIVVALHKKPVCFNPIIFITKELTFKGSIGYDTEFEQVLGFMASGKADLKPTITHRFPLSEIETALHTATKQDEALKVLIEMPE
jgi:threonine dehydrogenase-like Zn-dependent dehydrogenase